MNYSGATLNDVKVLIKSCLSKLYKNDAFLFERNNRRGVSERCLVFRFAHYLQNEVTDYFVDCDFNSSFVTEEINDGQVISNERNGKIIQNQDGSTTNRFVDIIVHKRDYATTNDYICFEIKKWNNAKDIDKDLNNLRQLTSQYSYKFGFLITFGRKCNESRWRIFAGGREVTLERLIFDT